MSSAWVLGESDDHIAAVYASEDDARRVLAYKERESRAEWGTSHWWIEEVPYFAATRSPLLRRSPTRPPLAPADSEDRSVRGRTL